MSRVKYNIGEKVLCYHGNRLYDAKILIQNFSTRPNQYKVHYIGWNSHWDEWLTEHRIVQFNEANKRLQKEKFTKYGDNRKLKARRRPRKVAVPKNAETNVQKSAEIASTPKRPTRVRRPKKSPKKKTVAATKPRKPRKGHVTASDDDSSALPNEDKENRDENVPPAPIEDDDMPTTSRAAAEEFSFPNIKIPEGLKLCLSIDWINMSRNGQLLRLPAAMSIEELFQRYLTVEISSQSKGHFVFNEVLQGILEYFNVTLGTQLLFTKERKQYEKLIRDYPQTAPSKLYGPYHLLRLFVILGKCVRESKLENPVSKTVLANLYEFINYLDRNRETIFDETCFYKPKADEFEIN